MRLGSCGTFGETGKSAPRVTGSLQQGGLGAPQCIVVREFFEGLADCARRLDDIAGAHPDELRQPVVGLGVVRSQPDAFAQGELGLLESLQSEQAAGVRVM